MHYSAPFQDLFVIALLAFAIPLAASRVSVVRVPTLRALHLPGDCTVVLVRRKEGLFVPNGNTVLRFGDVLTFIGSDEAVESGVRLIASNGSYERDAALLERETGRVPVWCKEV